MTLLFVKHIWELALTNLAFGQDHAGNACAARALSLIICDYDFIDAQAFS
jgi:hypothetical protein